MGVVVGLGEVLWDVFPDRKLLGGAPANFAFHAKQLGHEGIVVSRVGNDAAGREILRELSIRGVPTESIQVDPVRPTGTVQVTVASDGVPSFVITPDVAWDYLAAEPALVELMKRADAVCFGTLAQRSPTSRSTIETLLDGAGGMKVFDINLRQNFWSPELIERGLRRSQVAKLNEDELETLQRLELAPSSGNTVTCCRALLKKYGLRLVALTRASRGALLVADDQVVDHPGVQVRVADGVGAGDAFAAAMVDALLKGRALVEVAGFANRIGAYVASQPGAMPILPEDYVRG